MNEKIVNEGNQIHNFISSSSQMKVIKYTISSSGSGTVYNNGSGSDFLTSYGSGFGSGSTSQKVTIPMVPVPFPVPQRCKWVNETSESMRQPLQTLRSGSK